MSLTERKQINTVIHASSQTNVTDNELLIQTACKIIYHNKHLYPKNAEFRKISALKNIFNSLSCGPPKTLQLVFHYRIESWTFKSVIFSTMITVIKLRKNVVDNAQNANELDTQKLFH